MATLPRTAILTRPGLRNAALGARLQRAGWDVLCAPALLVEPVLPGPDGLPRPGDYDLVIFVSGFAAQTYLAQLTAVAGAQAWPLAVHAATVGPASARALREHSAFGRAPIVHMPGPQATLHDSEALYDALRKADIRPERVLIVRGTRGREWLADRLRSEGAHVDVHAAYCRSPATWPADVLDKLTAWQAEGRYVAWLYTSAESIEAVAATVAMQGWGDWWSDSAAVLTHPKLLAALTVAGRAELSVVKVCIPDDDAVFEAFVAL